MARAAVEAVDVPSAALASCAFGPSDYADAFRVQLPADPRIEMIGLTQHLFGRIESYPTYVRALLRLRDLLVKPFGLKRAVDLREVTDTSNWIGFFRIYQRSEDEIIIGADDQHLDVRISLLRGGDDESPFLTLSTFVRLNNLLGKIYFAVVRPLHRVIVPDTLEKGIQALLDARRG